MALGGFPIPPWLVTRPAEHAQASAEGLSAGLQAAHIWAAANEERARLEEAQRRADMQNALDQEALQQKSIYEAQKIATDREYNKAALGQAQARIAQTQQNAAMAVQKWTEQQAIERERATDLAQYRAAQLGQAQQRIAISKQKADELRTTKLSPEAQVDDDLLKQKIVQANAEIKAAHDQLMGSPKNEKFKRTEANLVKERDDLILKRKKLRGFTGFEPVMGKRQEADATSMRFSVTPVDQSDENEGD